MKSTGTERRRRSASTSKTKLEKTDTRAAGRQRTPIIRRNVLDAAADLFAERGYGGTNLRDVADKLKMSRTALYYHFPSKEKLLEALIEEVTVATEQQYQQLASQQDLDPEHALRRVTALTARWVMNHRILFRVLDRSEAEITTDLRRSHAASKRSILSNLVSIIERGIRSGVFRPDDSHVAAFAILGMCNWTAWWFKPDGRLSEHDIAEIMAEMAIRMLVRSDAHRSRSDRVSDALRILKEDVAHLTRLIGEPLSPDAHSRSGIGG
jgi:AcrR family transcriptional regulator